MPKRRCILRADPKNGRKKGRCLLFARPGHQKKSDAKKMFKLGEYAAKPRRRRVRRTKRTSSRG
jgi:hypothetical protein